MTNSVGSKCDPWYWSLQAPSPSDLHRVQCVYGRRGQRGPTDQTPCLRCHWEKRYCLPPCAACCHNWDTHPILLPSCFAVGGHSVVGMGMTYRAEGSRRGLYTLSLIPPAVHPVHRRVRRRSKWKVTKVDKTVSPQRGTREEKQGGR